MKPFVCLSLLALSSSLAHADDTAIRKAIQARYAELSKAFAHKDAKAFEAGFTMDFTAKGPNGQTMKRAELIKDFTGQMNALNDVDWVQTIKTLKVDGKIVHVVIDSHMTATMKDAKGGKHTFRLESKNNKSDWVKGSSGWQVKSSATGELKMWVDGKPMKNG